MFKEPLAVYTNPADFGEPVSVDGKTVYAIVDREYLADALGTLTAANADPCFAAADADLPPHDVLRQAQIELRGRRYAVAEIDFDGSGITVVQLRSEPGNAPDY